MNEGLQMPRGASVLLAPAVWFCSFPLQPVEKNLLVSDPGLDEFKEQLFNWEKKKSKDFYSLES